MASNGTHILRIEQVRNYKNKYFKALIPLYVLDASLLDKSPFYSIYEVEFYLDKDISIDVTLGRTYIKPKKFTKVMRCSFNVVFDREVETHLLRNEFIASDKEKNVGLDLALHI